LSAPVWIAVAALGAVGALARFLVDGVVSARVGREFPLGTLVVNVSGAVVLGLIVGLGFSGIRLTLVGSATLGSYTTFSTWMFETQRLVEEGEIASATGNAVISLAVGVAAAALGRLIGTHL
jgi:fluoride exporter